MTSPEPGPPALPISNLESGTGRSAARSGLTAEVVGAEMELQKLLIDERMKCESHRIKFQTLKAEHESLQTQQEKLQMLHAELGGELLDKARELEELRLQVMTPQRLELLRAQVQQEMEAPVRKRFIKLEQEAEKYRSEYNKLQYEHTLLKSQLDHQREEHARTLEESRIQYQAELSRLEKEREDMEAQYQASDLLRDGKRVENLLRERAQLYLRLKGLETEMAELQAQKENSGQQAENIHRLQLRQLSEAQATLKSVEAERQSLRLQQERREKELHQSQEQNSHLTGRLYKAEQQVNSLTYEIENLKLSHKMEVASIKLECTRAKGEVGREKDKLQGQVDALQTDVEVLKLALDQHKEALVEKEREMLRKVQFASEEELRKTATLHEEKWELEDRLAALERQRSLQDAADHSQKEKWEGHVRRTQQREESARRELQNLRTKLQQQSAQLEELERQKALVAELKQHNQDLGVQLGTLSHSESDMMEKNQHLRETLDRLREELMTTQQQAERKQHEAERMLEDRQVEWLGEKHRMQEREAELQHKLTQLKEKIQRAAVAHNTRKNLTEDKEKRLQDKIQLLEAKREELEVEVAAAKKTFSVSQERLKNLQRRHHEFQRILLGIQGPLPTHHGAEGPLSNITHNQDLGVQLGTLSHSESDMMEKNQHLRETLDRLREELRTTQGQAERKQHEAERYMKVT